MLETQQYESEKGLIIPKFEGGETGGSITLPNGTVYNFAQGQFEGPDLTQFNTTTEDGPLLVMFEKKADNTLTVVYVTLAGEVLYNKAN